MENINNINNNNLISQNSNIQKQQKQTLVIPKEKTLSKYGITKKEWLQMARKQRKVCAICKKFPSTGKLHIDHEHIKNFKKLPPQEKKQYIRGLLCWTCNYFIMSKNVSIDKLKNAIKYLYKYYKNKHYNKYLVNNNNKNNREKYYEKEKQKRDL